MIFIRAKDRNIKKSCFMKINGKQEIEFMLISKFNFDIIKSNFENWKKTL